MKAYILKLKPNEEFSVVVINGILRKTPKMSQNPSLRQYTYSSAINQYSNQFGGVTTYPIGGPITSGGTISNIGHQNIGEQQITVWSGKDKTYTTAYIETPTTTLFEKEEYLDSLYDFIASTIHTVSQYYDFTNDLIKNWNLIFIQKEHEEFIELSTIVRKDVITKTPYQLGQKAVDKYFKLLSFK